MKTNNNTQNKNGDLSVWWIPQIPGEPFRVIADSVDEAKKIVSVLADYDQFQHQNNIKPDYCNAGGLDVFEDGYWETWYDNEGNEIDDLLRSK